MCFGRHNNGNFKETHPGGVPIIHDYDDVYSFLVESPEHSARVSGKGSQHPDGRLPLAYRVEELSI
jgi:hypothetical protein